MSGEAWDEEPGSDSFRMPVRLGSRRNDPARDLGVRPDRARVRATGAYLADGTRRRTRLAVGVVA